jgi:hypothetical protein
MSYDSEIWRTGKQADKVNLIDVLFIAVYKISSIQYSAEFRK